MKKVKAWRKEKKLCQAAVAAHLEITQGTYSKYEAMQMVMPPILANKLIAYSKGVLQIVDFYSWISRAHR